MTTPSYNIALLEQVRDVIANEDHHDQGIWMRISRRVLTSITDRWFDKSGSEFIAVSCPTAACVAGWAASLCGGKMIVGTDEIEYSNGSVEATEVLVDGEPRLISTFAREQLGLTGTEADALFAAEWTNEEVLENLDDIILAAKHNMRWEVRHHDDDYDGADY